MLLKFYILYHLKKIKIFIYFYFYLSIWKIYLLNSTKLIYNNRTRFQWKIITFDKKKRRKESLLLRIFSHRRKVHSIGKCTHRTQEPALRFTFSPPSLHAYRQLPLLPSSNFPIPGVHPRYVGYRRQHRRHHRCHRCQCDCNDSKKGLLSDNHKKKFCC